MDRYGFVEETYFTFSYSPVPDEGGVGGILVTCTENTGRVIGERRVRMLRDLGARSGDAMSADEACQIAVETFARNAKDIPFVLIYLLEAGGTRARLAGAVGGTQGGPASPAMIDFTDDVHDDRSGWPIAEVARSGRPLVVDDVLGRFGPLVAGEWPEPLRDAVVLPVPSTVSDQAAGVLVCGVSPRLRLDDSYCQFLDIVAGQVGAAVANARAYEEERRRAEALAELDRAKTQFFWNVSHEFRTPLTLVLGPTRDALADENTIPENRRRFELIQRNAERLLKLVNTLLDFSRIEAGRIEAFYEPVNFSDFCAELASVFRSAVEKAGLRLVVDCHPLREPVFLDRAMWEKVVLNLLSNAFKHTFEGEIGVATRARDGFAELEVRDTGIGIDAAQLPLIFQRFHRVPNARSRTHEGTGIGLAFVQELVRLHGGSIDVTSKVGVGTTFTVRIPLGAAHLPAERVGGAPPGEASGLTAGIFTAEAAGWLPNEAADRGREESDPAAMAGRILVADDNADMRSYIVRLLREHGWSVVSVANGTAALEAVRAAAAEGGAPDVLVADVMMPGLDGFQLLGELRADPVTSDVPVVLLSARAGEESRMHGLEAGADDYLVKPFVARELLARVAAAARIGRDRRATRATERAYEALRAAKAEVDDANRAKSAFLATMSHELRTPLNAIAGHVQLLEMGLHGPISEAQRTALARIERSQRHLLRLINDVLNLARIEAGGLEFRLGDLAVAEIIADLAPLIEPQLSAKLLHYDVRLAASDVMVRGDLEKVQQILLNLLSNAIKFTDPGGTVTIDVAKRAGAAGFVFLRVSDTGKGIPPDRIEQIFEPFVQVHVTGIRTAEGVGLGLSISRELARGMGGDLRARSTLGKGSTFTLTLPAAGK
jgi:signal transduction histidine kinase